MTILDRYIGARFIVNFALLFALLFLFASTIDVVLNLDEFVDAAKMRYGDDANGFRKLMLVIWLASDYQAPRLFQFYGYLHGMVAIGAMGFTLAQLHKHKELVAIMASGVSLHRVAMPFIVCMFILSSLQLVNKEFMLPKVAPLVLRGREQIGQRGVDAFPVPLTPGRGGTLLQAVEFNPVDQTLVAPTILVRDEGGRTIERIAAEHAHWDVERLGWVLENGMLTRPAADDGMASVVLSRPIEFYETDLTPELLLVRRYRTFASMLSLRQISRMLQSDTVTDVDSILRFRYSRFSNVITNVLMMVITLPAFLLREPGGLFKQSVICSAITLPAMLGTLLMVTVNLPGISPAVGVFLPAILLIPVAVARMTLVRT